MAAGLSFQVFVAMDFYEVGDSLAAAGALGGPAELQGMLCGRLCGGIALAEPELLALAADFLALEDDGLQQVAVVVKDLHDQLRAQLVGGQLNLRLMLPEDDETMTRRLTALGDWCQGFLVGLGQGGLGAPGQLTPEVNEILQDLAAIAQVDDDVDESVEDEDDEAAYAELVEYVRIVAITLHEELADPDAPEPVKPTLH